LRARSRPLAILAAAVAVIAIFPLAGMPLAWLRHVRLAVGADVISQGLSALPRAFVPYSGINEWVRLVIVLGGGGLLVSAGLALAWAGRALSENRRGLIAFPLVVLAVVPSTLVRPQLAYLHGLILFVLLAAFVWGERISGRDTRLALAITALAGAAAMIAAPALDQHKPWFDYEALAGKLTAGHVEAFDWSQRYGPLNWPRTGREVLDVAAARPDYWKTENLELFSGSGWLAGSTNYGAAAPEPSPAAISRWSQTIQVTLRAIRTQQVVAAGYASAPGHVSQPIAVGLAAGTWTAPTQLQPGDSYQVTTYSPQPTAAELAAAPRRYPAAALQPNLTVVLPQRGLPDEQIVFPPLGADAGPVDIATGEDGRRAIDASPYGRVYALAQRLAGHARTPAAYAASVLSYLAHGYTYDENPLPSRYPLVSFLFNQKAGYCQQFAGAMALLLRMGGVPARVATGFTTGSYDRNRHQYVVSDLDAHAWVEAWFPRYGWVRFDPTPRSAPARSGHIALPAIHGSAALPTPVAPVRHGEPTSAPAPRPIVSHGGGVPTVVIVVVIVGLLALLAVCLALTLRLREPTEEQLLAELERALRRCGRPVSDGLTLAELEHRLRATPEAAAYVRAIRKLRFAGGRAFPTPAQRRALRTQLRYGLGATGWLRALWALPPQWTPKCTARRRPPATARPTA
jgi:protein-glutamine gamma-glutamyltransferase